jgi:hypothetical protein
MWSSPFALAALWTTRQAALGERCRPRAAGRVLARLTKSTAAPGSWRAFRYPPKADRVGGKAKRNEAAVLAAATLATHFDRADTGTVDPDATHVVSRGAQDLADASTRIGQSIKQGSIAQGFKA